MHQPRSCYKAIHCLFEPPSADSQSEALIWVRCNRLKFLEAFLNILLSESKDLSDRSTRIWTRCRTSVCFRNLLIQCGRYLQNRSSSHGIDNVAVVTGANRGIGLEIVRSLAEQGLTVVLTARDETKGKAAVNELSTKGLKTIVFHQLDPTDTKSVDGLAAWLKSEYGGIDILINNAAIMYTEYSYESAKSVIDTNYYGVKTVNASLLPLLRPSLQGARIVNVSSRGGLYEKLPSEPLKKIFRDEDNYSEKVADSLAEKYLADMKAGKAEAEGWLPDTRRDTPIYSESKMFLNVYTNALAKSFAKTHTKGNEIFYAGMCPGQTVTEMLQELKDMGWSAPPGFPLKTAAEGAETAVWLALLPKKEWDGKTGKLFAEKTEYSFGLIIPK